MNYLLDTHAFIWAMADKGKLSAKAIQIIHDSNNSIFVSAVTFWEIALKFSINKLDIQGISPDELPGLSVKTGFKLIDFLPEESASHYKLPITTHKDPFDRMLVWQAIKRDYVLISKDIRINPYTDDGLKILW
ncbi:MAG: type II toxin-antitoxin system VapC family toxin [Mucilaginibacter sp.]